MSNDAAALLRLERNLLKVAVPRQVGAIKLRQEAIHEHVLRLQEFPIIGTLTPDHLVDEEIERGAQVGQQRVRKIRKYRSVFGNILALVHLKPMMEEVAQFCF